jgi:hypothetical protein
MSPQSTDRRSDTSLTQFGAFGRILQASLVPAREGAAATASA